MKISDELWDGACEISERMLADGACVAITDDRANDYFDALFSDAWRANLTDYWLSTASEYLMTYGTFEWYERRFMALLMAYECAKAEGL